MSGSLIGRTAELDAVARFLAALTRGSAALVLDGPAGSGKSALLRVAASQARVSGVRVLRWERGALGPPPPFGALAALLGGIDLGGLPVPQREALKTALGAAGGAASRGAAASVGAASRGAAADPAPGGAASGRATASPDPRAVATAAATLLAGIAREGPLMLALDGAELLDRPSALALEFCVRRLPPGAGLLLTRLPGDDGLLPTRLPGDGGPLLTRLPGDGGLLSMRPPSDDGLLPTRPPGDGGEGCGLVLAALRGTDHAERHLLGPLSADELERLLRQRLPQPLPARATLARLCATAAGNPGHALALAAHAASAVAVIEGGGGSPAPVGGRSDSAPPPLPTAPPPLLAALAALDADAAEALLAVVSVSAATLPLLRRALGPGATARVERLEARGLVTLAGERISAAHPLLAGAVRAGADDERRRALHHRLADATDEPEERARQFAHAHDRRALPALRDAADAAAARGAPATAAELLELALNRRDDPLLRLRAARHHCAAGDPAQAEAHVLSALLALGGAARAEALLLLAELRSHDDSHPRARALLEQARASAGDDDRLLAQARAAAGDDGRLLARIDLRLAVVLANLGLVTAALAPAAAARAEAERQRDDGLLAQALALETALAFALGRGLDEPRLRRALMLEDAGGAFELRPSLLAAQLLLWSGRLDEAAALADGVAGRQERAGAAHELAWTAFTRAAIACWRGELEAAAAVTDDAVARLDALGTMDARGLALTARAQLAARAGRADDACADAAAALELFARSGWRTAAWRPLHTLGVVALSRGDVEAAAGWIAEPTLAALDAGLADPLPWGGALSHGDAVEALVGCGRLAEARRIAAVLERRGAGAERRWPRGIALRARGLLLAAAGELAAAEDCLQAALDAHAPLPLPLERARGLLLLGRVQRRRRRAAARDSLERALALFEELGAPLWGAQARAELQRLGPAARAPDELTAAERRVVELVVTGMTNREVAAALFLSPKTVEAHLARVYRKLGIRSRAELGSRLAQAR